MTKPHINSANLGAELGGLLSRRESASVRDKLVGAAAFGCLAIADFASSNKDWTVPEDVSLEGVTQELKAHGLIANYMIGRIQGKLITPIPGIDDLVLGADRYRLAPLNEESTQAIENFTALQYRLPEELEKQIGNVNRILTSSLHRAVPVLPAHLMTTTWTGRRFGPTQVNRDEEFQWLEKHAKDYFSRTGGRLSGFINPIPTRPV